MDALAQSVEVETEVPVEAIHQPEDVDDREPDPTTDEAIVREAIERIKQTNLPGPSVEQKTINALARIAVDNPPLHVDLRFALKGTHTGVRLSVVDNLQAKATEALDLARPDDDDESCIADEPAQSMDALAQFEDELEPDPPAPKDMDAEIKRLAKLSPLEYDREREAVAKALGVRAGTLDKEVYRARGEADEDSQDDVIEELEPWDAPVSGEILDEIRADFGRHVIASRESLDTAALWTLGSYCFDAFTVWSKLFFSSPERRCGKTVALEVLEANSCRSLMASSITSSAIFRAVNAWKPTLIIDEADTFGKDDEELAGIINAGHRKRSAFVVRNVKVNDEHMPKKFSVWSPMAIAAIGRLRDTVMDRSAIVHMQRKAPGETAIKIPPDLFERNRDRRRRCLRWAQDNIARLRVSGVAVPNYGNDRAQDNWEPLFRIASLVGGDWPRRVKAAFAVLATEEEEESIGPMLLEDIRSIFDDKALDKIPSRDLVTALIDMEGRPWSEWRRGKPMTQNSLAKLLDPYKIHPGTIRVRGETPKGYRLEQFRNAFDRYLAPPSQQPPNQTATTPHPSNGGGYSEIQTATVQCDVADSISRKPSNGGGCGVVAVQNAGYEDAGIDVEEF